MPSLLNRSGLPQKLFCILYSELLQDFVLTVETLVKNLFVCGAKL